MYVLWGGWRILFTLELRFPRRVFQEYNCDLGPYYDFQEIILGGILNLIIPKSSAFYSYSSILTNICLGSSFSYAFGYVDQ